MSQTLAQLTLGVRALLKDFDNPPEVDGPVQIYRSLVRNAQIFGEDARGPRIWATNYVTSVANSLGDLTFPVLTSTAYQAIEEIRDPENAKPLSRIRPEEIDWLRRGIRSGTSGQGDPIAYALWEDAANVVTLRWDRVPSRAIRYDVAYRGTVPELMTDSTAIDMAAPLLHALEAATAIDLYSSLSTDAKTRLGLPSTPADSRLLLEAWTRVRDSAIARERFRKDNMSGRPYGAGYVVS